MAHQMPEHDGLQHIVNYGFPAISDPTGLLYFCAKKIRLDMSCPAKHVKFLLNLNAVVGEVFPSGLNALFVFHI